MAEEPIDQFYTNLYIYGLIQKKKVMDMKKQEFKARVKSGNR